MHSLKILILFLGIWVLQIRQLIIDFNGFYRLVILSLKSRTDDNNGNNVVNQRFAIVVALLAVFFWVCANVIGELMSGIPRAKRGVTVDHSAWPGFKHGYLSNILLHLEIYCITEEKYIVNMVKCWLLCKPSLIA